MGIYTDELIIGLRILIEMPHGGGDYYVKYEFTDVNWKIEASQILPHFFGKSGVKIQTLHPFSTSHNIQTGKTEEPGNIWIDNFYFKLEDLTY
jgi:hypothetical protein